MTPPVVLEQDRLALAESFLREAVYRSRERQSAVAAIRAPAIANPNCGLGDRAVAALDLSPRAREILLRIHPEELGETALGELREVMSAWVDRQDELDRKRNHFLKDFRGRNGFDRTRYSAEVQAEFEAGLARINAEEDRARRAAAERLVVLAG